MSGSIGANRIPREAVEPTVKKYIENILKKYPPFRSAKISGSYNTVVKADHGDLDLIIHVDAGEDDKKILKKKFAEYLNSLSDDIIVPFKAGRHQGKKTAGTGDIVITQIPVEGYPDLTVQVDNMIVTSEQESDYRKSFLDIPGEKQALIIGLVKTILMEENPEEVFKRLGIKDLPKLDPNQEFEFNLSSKGLTLRLVTLDDNYKEIARNDIWDSFDWNDVVKLFSKYDLNSSFEDLLAKIKTGLKNPRSKNRIKGLFKSMLVIGAGEKGTPKGDNKEQALAQISQLEENLNGEKVTALYPGKFKPPHKGHLNVLNQLSSNPNVEKVIVLVSPKTHEGITAEQSLDIWKNLYLANDLIVNPKKVDFVTSQVSPVKDVYDIVTSNPDTNFIAAYGKEESGAYKGLASANNFKAYDAGNIEGINATNLRAALRSQGDITPFIPQNVSSISYLEKLGNILHENLNEYTNQSTLNPVVFDGTTIKPKVREILLKIANYFWDSMELDIPFEDILLLGSSANYNWTPSSDIDLHLLVNYSQFADPELVKKYFDSVKAKFNEDHDLKIGDNEIELYIQDTNESNSSVGVFSVLNNKWIQEPELEKIEIPDSNINDLATPLKQEIDQLISLPPTEDTLRKLIALKDKIKQFRQSGLDKDGEYSLENLAFKELRNSGYIGKLLDYKNNVIDTTLTTEVFEKTVESYPFNESEEGTYMFTSESGNQYVVYLDAVSENRITVDFGIADETGDVDYPETNRGELFKIMSTIIAITKDYIKSHPNIEIISWSSVAKTGEKKIGDTQRDKIYKMMLIKQGGIKDTDIKMINGEYWAYLKGYDALFEKFNQDHAKVDLPEPFTYEDLSAESNDEPLSADDLKALDAYADEKLKPIDVNFIDIKLDNPDKDNNKTKPSIPHFLERSVKRKVTKKELEDFFDRLGLKKQDLVNKFKQAKEKGDKDIVVTDKKTNINIPFEDTTSSAADRMKNRIKSIRAKTVHKKPNFTIPKDGVRFTFTEAEKDPFGLNAYARELAKDLEETYSKPTQSPEQVMDFKTLLLSLTDHLRNKLNVTPLPKVKFIDNDVENANNILGRTAYYDPNNKSITLYTFNRHPKDVLRSYSHEMIHHMQNLENRLKHVNTTNINEDDYLKELEREAYEKGNILFREWENALENN
jgi:predicted nucleotidyltransferase